MEELDVLGELEVVEEYIESWEEAFELFHKAGAMSYRYRSFIYISKEAARYADQIP